MSATSVTGKGLGKSAKLTTNELATLANGPSIIFTGITNVVSVISSPPSISTSVTFPYPLPGGADKYVVLLTTINGGNAYIATRTESNGNFTGFIAVADTDCTVMYLVAKVGSRPQL